MSARNETNFWRAHRPAVAVDSRDCKLRVSCSRESPSRPKLKRQQSLSRSTLKRDLPSPPSPPATSTGSSNRSPMSTRWKSCKKKDRAFGTVPRCRACEHLSSLLFLSACEGLVHRPPIHAPQRLGACVCRRSQLCRTKQHARNAGSRLPISRRAACRLPVADAHS